jgi:hypothetical protein
MVSHDPDNKIVLKKGKRFFKGVKTKTSHYKTYPTSGGFAGGIVFWRYYGHGDGIGFTKAECEGMWGHLSLEDHMVRIVPVPLDGDQATTPQPAVDGAMTPHLAPSAPVRGDVPRVGDSVAVHWTDPDEVYSAVIVVRW